MNRKRFLIRIIGLFSLAGISAMAFIFSASFNPSAKAIDDASVLLDISNLVPGKVTMKEVKGKRLYFLIPNENQKKAIVQLNEHVWDNSLSNFVPAINAYVYWGICTKWWFNVEHMPPQDSRIKIWDEKAIWLGGYWDDICEVSYDYAGRAIKTHRYTFNGYTEEFPNLKKPILKINSHGKVIVSMF